MESIRNTIRDKAFEYLEVDNPDELEIDSALLEIASNFMVYSFLVENASNGYIEDVKETFNTAITGVEVDTEWEAAHLNAVLSVCLTLVEIAINNKKEEEDECF